MLLGALFQPFSLLVGHGCVEGYNYSKNILINKKQFSSILTITTAFLKHTHKKKRQGEG